MQKIIDLKLKISCPTCNESHYIPADKTLCIPCKVKELKEQKAMKKLKTPTE